MVGGDEELDDGLGEGGERGTFIDVFGAWGERISSRQRSADIENKNRSGIFVPPVGFGCIWQYCPRKEGKFVVSENCGERGLSSVMR